MKDRIATRGATALAIAAAGLLAAAIPASAQQEAGDLEFQLSGSGGSNNDLDRSIFGLSGSIGWFWTKGLEIGLRQDVGIADNPVETTATGTTRIFLDYHFDLDKFQPFIGASIGGDYGDYVDEGFVLGPEAGLKYYVKPKTFLVAQAAYQWNVDNDADEGTFLYSLGIGFNF